MNVEYGILRARIQMTTMSSSIYHQVTHLRTHWGASPSVHRKEGGSILIKNECRAICTAEVVYEIIYKSIELVWHEKKEYSAYAVEYATMRELSIHEKA